MNCNKVKRKGVLYGNLGRGVEMGFFFGFVLRCGSWEQPTLASRLTLEHCAPPGVSASHKTNQFVP